MKILFLFFFLIPLSLSAKKRPNIVWVIPDDMSAHFSCYGETSIKTPHLDQLAQIGVKFTNAYVTAPVCSTCRSAFITGMYQTSIGSQHHRVGRGKVKHHLPKHVKLVPQLFKEAGYYTTVSDWPTKPESNKLGKTDYNFEWDRSVYNGQDWANRKEGQPFFAQLQTRGAKLRGASRKEQLAWVREQAEKKLGSSTPISAVKLPPYYPAHPVILEDWAAYLDTVRLTDHMLGEVVARLKKEGILEETLILFMTDHGISHARGKQFLYDEGIHVPLVIAGPGITPASLREDPVEHIDIAALSLGAAGIPIPDYMQARDILASNYEPRVAAFSARDRCDETVDRIRSVRTKRFKYIRNFYPSRPYLQPCAYKDHKEILIALREWHQAGKLNPAQSLIFRESRPVEELYDLKADPYELNNLAGTPAAEKKLVELRDMLSHWMADTNDHGSQQEAMEMYDSDMQVYRDNMRRLGKTTYLEILEKNIALMKKWRAEYR